MDHDRGVTARWKAMTRAWHTLGVAYRLVRERGARSLAKGVVEGEAA